MNFDIEYTQAQSRFREEVADWLQAHVPAEIIDADEHFDPPERYQARRRIGRALGERGWLYPMSPRQYGGGGLDLDSALVILEELRRYGLGLPPYYDSGGVLGSAAILAWGTEQQRERLLPPIYSGRWRTWQLLTEPSAGSDIAAVAMTAVRDGDDYLVTGQKSFIGSANGADAFWTLTRTGPAPDRHRNLSWFMVDASSPGVTVTPQRIMGGIDKNTIFLDQVRVPAENLVGGENNGWQVAFTHLDHEHGLRSDRMLGQPLQDAWQAITRFLAAGSGQAADDPHVLETVAGIYVRKEVVRLIGARNYWLASKERPRTYEGPQGYYLEKKTTQWLARALADAFGQAAVTNLEGTDLGRVIVMQQVLGAVSMHGGGTGEIQKLLIARHLGLGKKD